MNDKQFLESKLLNFKKFLADELSQHPKIKEHLETFAEAGIDKLISHVKTTILPFETALGPLVDTLLSHYDIKPEELKPEVLNKLIRYLEMFCAISKTL
jgi:hypothetical protein